MEEKPKIKQIQTLSLELLAQQSEYQELKKLEGKNLIFMTISSRNRILGTLRGIGENYLFFDGVTILDDYDIKDYITGEHSSEVDFIEKKDFGIYNKRDIAEIYEFDE